MTRRASATVALPRTPARERFVAIVEAARDRAAERGLAPRAVYLTAEDAREIGLRLEYDPPRVLGIEIRPVKGKGSSRLYTKHGLAFGLGGIREKVK
jgi:hypothetical protein